MSAKQFWHTHHCLPLVKDTHHHCAQLYGAWVWADVASRAPGLMRKGGLPVLARHTYSPEGCGHTCSQVYGAGLRAALALVWQA